MANKGRPVSHLNDENWIWRLAISCDILQHVNTLNLQLQGKNKLISQAFTSVKCFEAKLELFAKQLSNKCLDNFPCCKRLDISLFPQDFAIKVITSLRAHFASRFSDFRGHALDFRIYQNPFAVDADKAPSVLQLELLELQSDDTIRDSYQQLDLIDFYRQLSREQFPNLRALSLKLTAMFGSTYVCEKTFSQMMYVKSRQRSRLTDEHLHDILRCGVTSLKPEMDKLSDSHQPQPSH